MYVGPWQELRLAQFLKAATEGEEGRPAERRQPRQQRRRPAERQARRRASQEAAARKEREGRMRRMRRLYGMSVAGGSEGARPLSAASSAGSAPPALGSPGPRLAPTPAPPRAAGLAATAPAAGERGSPRPGRSFRDMHDPLAQGAVWLARAQNRVVTRGGEGQREGRGGEPERGAPPPAVPPQEAPPPVPHRVRLPRAATAEAPLMSKEELARLQELVDAGRRAEEELERRRRSLTPAGAIHFRGELVEAPAEAGGRPRAAGARSTPYLELAHPPETRSDEYLYRERAQAHTPVPASPPSPAERARLDAERSRLVSSGSDFDREFDVDDVLGWAQSLGGTGGGGADDVLGDFLDFDDDNVGVGG